MLSHLQYNALMRKEEKGSNTLTCNDKKKKEETGFDSIRLNVIGDEV